MRDRLDELGDCVVVVVTLSEVAKLEPYRQHLGVDFTVLSDLDQAQYEAFGLGRGSLSAVYSLGTIRLYLQLLFKGRKMRQSTEDSRRLGGDFVLDAKGRLVASFRPSSPAERPTVDELASAVAQASA